MGSATPPPLEQVRTPRQKADLSRSTIVSALQEYSQEMVARVHKQVEASHHALNWYHFSTTAGVAFRHVACLGARVLLLVAKRYMIVAVLLSALILFCLWRLMWFGLNLLTWKVPAAAAADDWPLYTDELSE